MRTMFSFGIDSISSSSMDGSMLQGNSGERREKLSVINILPIKSIILPWLFLYYIARSKLLSNPLPVPRTSLSMWEVDEHEKEEEKLHKSLLQLHLTRLDRFFFVSFRIRYSKLRSFEAEFQEQIETFLNERCYFLYLYESTKNNGKWLFSV